MTDPTDDENDPENRPADAVDGEESGKDESGKGKKGKSGEGEAGGLSPRSVFQTNIARLAPQKLKEVMADWRHLTAQELVDAVIEFFGDSPMRASANAVVSWVKTANAKSFAIVNWVIEFGNKAVDDLVKNRERTAGRDTKGLRQTQKPQKPKPMTITPGIEGPTGPTGS